MARTLAVIDSACCWVEESRSIHVPEFSHLDQTSTSQVFRALILVAMCFLVAVLCMPFDRPFEVDVRLDEPPPPWLVTSAAMSLTLLLSSLAAIGLFLFRRWGRWLGAFLLGLGSLLVWPIAQSPLAECFGAVSLLCLAVVALAWLAAVVLSYLPVLCGRFKRQRAQA